MCVVSMVFDHYRDKWDRLLPTGPLFPTSPAPFPSYPSPVSPISEQEILEFRTLLQRAREYDKKHNEPDCELAEKKEALKKIAAALGVNISFIEEP